MEAHTMPLTYDSPFSPLRGRYCLDSSCDRLGDEDNYRQAVIYCLCKPAFWPVSLQNPFRHVHICSAFSVYTSCLTGCHRPTATGPRIQPISSNPVPPPSPLIRHRLINTGRLMLRGLTTLHIVFEDPFRARRGPIAIPVPHRRTSECLTSRCRNLVWRCVATGMYHANFVIRASGCCC